MNESIGRDSLHEISNLAEVSDIYNTLYYSPNLSGHQYNDPECGCPTRVIGDFEIIYFINGIGNITIKDTDYTCEKGDIILIRPYEEHSIQSSRENPYDNYFVHFDMNPSYLQHNFISDLFPDDKRKVKIGINSKLIELYTELIEEMSKKQTGHVSVCSGLFSVIMVSIVREIHKANSGTPFKQGKRQGFTDYLYIEKARNYILENYNRSISIKDMCAHLSISESYLFQLFKSHLDITPGKYITYTRMKKAEQMLKSSNKSIKEIAAFIGYEDPLYFTKAFKKIYGASPTQFLRYYNL